MKKIIIPVYLLAFGTLLPTNSISHARNSEEQIESKNTNIHIQRTNATDVEKRIKKIIIKCIDAEENELSLESNIIEDFGADSLDVIEIIMEIEKEFKIVILNEDINNIIILKDAVDYVNKKLINEK